jgi:hypothetical protein
MSTGRSKYVGEKRIVLYASPPNCPNVVEFPHSSTTAKLKDYGSSIIEILRWYPLRERMSYELILGFLGNISIFNMKSVSSMTLLFKQCGCYALHHSFISIQCIKTKREHWASTQAGTSIIELNG